MTFRVIRNYNGFRKVVLYCNSSRIWYDSIKKLDFLLYIYSSHVRTITAHEDVVSSRIVRERFHVTWDQTEKIGPCLTQWTQK